MDKKELIEWKAIDGFTRHERTQLFHNLNVTINKEDWITVLGHNGSGKSTLARMLSGHYSDQYEIEGQIQYSTNSSYPMLIQMTSEYLLGATPYEDMIIAYEQYGNREFAEIELEGYIDEVLQKLHILHLKHTEITSLSGGEKQLVALAGCLMMRSELIIFDEMTSMLAPEMKEHVLYTIREMWKQESFAVLWITQLPEELQHDDRVWVMKERALIYDGVASELYAGEREQSIADQLQLDIPWSVEKARQLSSEGIRLEHIPFAVTDLVRLVKRNGHRNGDG